MPGIYYCEINVLVSPTEMLTNALLPQKRDNSANSNTLENWVKNAADVVEPSNADNYSLDNGKLLIFHNCTLTLCCFLDAREYVIVTHIDSPELFYVQLVRFENKLHSLCKQIEQYIRDFAPIVKSVELSKYLIFKNIESTFKTICLKICDSSKIVHHNFEITSAIN